jgi:hypothetical protein
MVAIEALKVRQHAWSIVGFIDDQDDTHRTPTPITRAAIFFNFFAI